MKILTRILNFRQTATNFSGSFLNLISNSKKRLNQIYFQWKICEFRFPYSIIRLTQIHTDCTKINRKDWLKFQPRPQRIFSL